MENMFLFLHQKSSFGLWDNSNQQLEKKVKKVKFTSCRCRSSAAIIILHHALMAKADRQPPPCMFTDNIAFKETPSFKAPENGPDISREHSLKGAVFIVMSIESDNNSLHLPASLTL